MQTFAAAQADQKHTTPLLTATLAFALVLMTIVTLMAAKSLLVPLAIAILLWFIINALARRIALLFGKKGEPGLGVLLTSILVVIAVCIGVAEIIAFNATEMVQRIPTYFANIDKLTERLSSLIGLEAFGQLMAAIDTFDFEGLFISFANGAAGIAGSAGTVVLYIAFLLVEQQFIGKKLRAMASNDARHAKMSAVFNEIGKRVRTYLFTKSMTSAAMAGMVGIALEIADIDFSGFWAFLVFILNFIPVVGGIVSGVFPAALALIQFPTLTPFFTVVAGVGLAHLLIGNIVEPRYVGGSVNLSPLVVILALSVWGFIWGVPGMFLCVPITVIGMIIFSEFQSTHPIAIALSENGEID